MSHPSNPATAAPGRPAPVGPDPRFHDPSGSGAVAGALHTALPGPAHAQRTMHRGRARASVSRGPAFFLAAAGVLVLGLGGCGGADSESQAAQAPGIADHLFADPEVTRIHTRMVEAMAPDNGWERTRYLEFDWAVNRGDAPPTVRAHRWDRWEGEARVEAPTQDGGSYVAIFNTADPEAGRVWVDGEEVTGEAAASRLQGAYRAHINDGYWLLMPYKWTDPGVNARYVGVETDEETGETFELVELSFEEVGLTPQNMYRAWVNTESGLMERWEHFSNPEANPSPSTWEEWTRVGPLSLAMNRRSGGELRIFFSHVLAAERVPEGAFAPPAPE
jgi:hypothetical protein